MKIRIIKLTPESLAGMLQGKPSTFTSNLPSDAEILDIKMDLFTKQVSIVVRSESFEDVAEALPIPEFQISKAVEVKGTPEAKSLVAKLPQPQPSRMASKMENEFSPEQRKLLSFTVKENYVVAKPVVFLKTEWDDINEVVRSLGGKWVKGDIISYWEIPLL
jgi:nitrogen regulatory protein PII